MKKREKRKTSAAHLDRLFDEGDESIDRYLDYDRKKVVEPTNVLVSFPRWMLEALDEEANRLGINRQAVIKMLIDEGLRLRSAAKEKDRSA
jgi:hypothetical protein